MSQCRMSLRCADCNNNCNNPPRDLFAPEDALPSNCEFIKGNLLDEKVVDRAVSGCDVVFHTASAGMSGSLQLEEALCRRVNVDGTNLIMSLCVKNCVERLVYTSSYNVIFSKHALGQV